ncbi:MAG: putative 2OG-Fe(II) oxygenase, partial [Gammaproteobacteria bacterium]
MAKDSLIQAFATPVLTRQVDGAAALNGTLAHTIRELARRGPSHDRYRSHQGGFYTPGTLFEQDLPGLAEIQRAMRTGVRTYVDLVAAAGFGRKRAIPDEWILLQGWAALTGAGDYQPPHVHAGSNMSCVYYVEVPAKPEPQGCIDLMNPLTVQEMTFIPGANTTHCRVVPRPGMLLIFPAYVPHTVHPFQRRRRAARRGRERDDPAAMSGAAKERGAVYVATRNPSYVVLAAASARSLRQHAPEIPITLFTNVLEIPAELRRAFDTVTTIPSPKRIGADWANGLIDKIHGIRHTPYERTFFIDADTVVRSRDVAEAFDWLDDYDLLIT